MSLNNLFNTNGGIYVRPIGLPDCYPVAGFPHGCKSLLPPSTTLTMQSFSSHKSTYTMAAISPLQMMQQPNTMVSSYSSHMLNTSQTSSFAAALRKLAKQAGEPTAGNNVLSSNSVVNQPSVIPPMYLTNHQNSFVDKSSPAVNVTSMQHSVGNRKAVEPVNFSASPAVGLSNSHITDITRGKYSSFNINSNIGKWDEHNIGTKELISSAQVMTSASVSSSSSLSSSSEIGSSSGKGFQPYKSVEDKQHISSHFPLYDSSYSYLPSNFLSSPQIPPHAYRLEDAFYLEHYGLLRSPMIPFATPALIPHSHSAFYHTGAYPSELLTQHIGLSSSNLLFEQERLKREEQRFWPENKETTKLKDQDVDRMKPIVSTENSSSLVISSKNSESIEKQKKSSIAENKNNSNSKQSVAVSDCHSAPLNLSVHPKVEPITTSSTEISKFKKIENNHLERTEMKLHQPDDKCSQSKTQFSETKNVKSDEKTQSHAHFHTSNNSIDLDLDKNELTLLHQRKETDIQKSYVEQKNREIEKCHYESTQNNKEKKFQSLEILNKKLQTWNPYLSLNSEEQNTQLQEQYSIVKSKLDVEEKRKRAQPQENNLYEDERYEEKKYHFLHIITKGPPLLLDSSPKKLKFLEQFSLVTEEKKKKIEMEKYLYRRERLKENNVSPPVETDDDVEANDSKSDGSLEGSCVVPILMDKLSFMKLINLCPATVHNSNDDSDRCGVKRKFEKAASSDDITSENGTEYFFNLSNHFNLSSVYNSNLLGIIPLVHSAHLYEGHLSKSRGQNICSSPPMRKLCLNGGSVNHSLLKCSSKKSRYSKLWIPNHTKTKQKYKNLLEIPEDCYKDVQNVDRATFRSKILKLDDKYHQNKSNYICDTKEQLFHKVERNIVRNNYQWPGIETVMESYNQYLTEQNLEMEILTEKYQLVKGQKEKLIHELESRKSRMLKLLEEKNKLHEDKTNYLTAIDNLKKYLQALR